MNFVLVTLLLTYRHRNSEGKILVKESKEMLRLFL